MISPKFHKNFPQIHLIAISGHYMRFIFNIFQTTTIFEVSFFGGCLLFSRTVRLTLVRRYYMRILDDLSFRKKEKKSSTKAKEQKTNCGWSSKCQDSNDNNTLCTSFQCANSISVRLKGNNLQPRQILQDRDDRQR